jgi:hypothetical protein
MTPPAVGMAGENAVTVHAKGQLSGYMAASVQRSEIRIRFSEGRLSGTLANDRSSRIPGVLNFGNRSFTSVPAETGG